MHKWPLQIFLVFFSISLNAQIPVWQGFEMNWTYNHRLNRLGSFVSDDSVYNTASAGTSIDSGWFSTHYLLVPEAGLQFQQLKISQRVEARENEIIRIQIDTVVPVSFHHSVFFLNGFDISANNDADQLQLIKFGVKMLKGNYDSTWLRINMELNFNCPGLSCDWLNNQIDYDVSLYVGGVYFANRDYISFVKGEILTATESWTRKKNTVQNKIFGNNKNVQFITDFELSLNKSHLYSGMQVFIDSNNVSVMRFEQYKDRMKKNAYYKPHGNFSVRSPGSVKYGLAGISLSYPVLQIQQHKEFKGNIIWKSNDRNPVKNKPVNN